MDYNTAKMQGFYDELEKMGGWAALAGLASRAVPAIARAGAGLFRGGAGKKLMGATSFAPGLMGGAKRQTSGIAQGLGGRRPLPNTQSFM